MAVDPIFITTTIVNCYGGITPKGSASGFFFQSDPGSLYLITNKHVIYGEEFAALDAKPEIDKIGIVLHTDRADLRQNKEIYLQLIVNGNRMWREHIRPEVDVIAIPIDLPPEALVVPFDQSVLDCGNIEIGLEKIFIMGYPLGWYDHVFNLPITRVGHLSSPFGVPFRGHPFMLGDVETHKGMSGSPVTIELRDYVVVDENGKKTRHLGTARRLLAGVFSGQPIWRVRDSSSGAEQDIPHSLSVVWFGSLILEIIR